MALTKVQGEGISGVSISANNEITMSSQPAFNAYKNVQNNIAVGSDVTVEFENERFDNNGDFSTPNFTAPVSGKYQFNVSIYLNSVDTASAYYYVELSTSNEQYYNIIDSTELASDAAYWGITLSHVVDMDANDTARIDIQQANGTQQTDVNANSFFSGYLVC